MGFRRRITSVVLGVVLFAFAPACRRNEPDLRAREYVPRTTGATTTDRSSSIPADHLAPDELLEGTESAFGIPLPRGIRIEHRFVDLVLARGQGQLPQVSKYIAARVRGGNILHGSERTEFRAVNVPSAPTRELSITLEKIEGRTLRLEIRDTTPPPPSNLKSDEERWKAAGLKPNGEPLDPHTVR